MSPKSILRGGTLFALACLSLAACSNRESSDVTATDMLKGTFSAIFKRGGPKAPDPNLIAQTAAKILATTSGQVIFIAIPSRDAMTVMQEIERNGPYVTFGSSDRRSITLKGGIVTATRGLGNDLMSSDVDAVAAIIRARQDGAASRVNRYLDGENYTVALDPYCQIKSEGGEQVSLGEVHTSTTRMLESCIADKDEFRDTTFQNSYQVTPGGRIVQSRQWISPLNGYIVIQSLR
ncbi:YjbF family lipoprotein (plasmid) [Pseudohalocynthiibacter aestuariivivens]|uniref:YjbF family lipoprotein n=1 Tax=Roseovarius pelagicus TaxID=2980108 RepID=A0ABY6D5I8_9RHOB|nr:MULTISPECIES: YjbF family lipoprotein [Rhodobacterales]QIE47924.1 YjbF family lipoprotein [Pseudohalocynthiibacter aestuariivivens]UXX81417.1 YjbF family lipoprotein [Roseovarius pelagicus]